MKLTNDKIRILERMKLTNKDKIRILERAQDLIANPRNWTKGIWKSTGRTEGRPDVDYCYCLEGALYESIEQDPYIDCKDEGLVKLSLKESLLKHANKFSLRPYGTLFMFNDSLDTSHSDVMVCMSKTIDELKQRKETN